MINTLRWILRIRIICICLSDAKIEKLLISTISKLKDIFIQNTYDDMNSKYSYEQFTVPSMTLLQAFCISLTAHANFTINFHKGTRIQRQRQQQQRKDKQRKRFARTI